MCREKSYIAIDLKSFYASVECVERGLDPLTTNLVVADASRTDKTICLAVTPSLKAYGVSGRARMFEAIQTVQLANAQRRFQAPGGRFSGKSWDDTALKADPSLEIDFITAPPRMQHYMDCSARIYDVYLRHIAPEDIHVYSIDEVFIDATPYLKSYKLTPYELARKLIYEVLEATGITATAGIGPNLYLCKVAMDIVAKRSQPDEQGVRIAQLDELSYRQLLWDHRPLTDFWRVGRGYARKLEAHGFFTMGDVARYSLENEGAFYHMFGINAQLLIDHAWGWEPCTMADIKAYRPSTNSISTGQVLHCPYSWEKARLILREMTDLLVLDLVEKNLVTDQMVLTVGYDRESLLRPRIADSYTGPVTTDHYGRQVPRHAHGTANLPRQTASTRLITQAVMDLYDRITDRKLLVRRVNLTAARVVREREEMYQVGQFQLNLFEDFDSDLQRREAENAQLRREKRRQQAILRIRKKYGKNAILKGMNFEEGATTISRNNQIGGHKA